MNSYKSFLSQLVKALCLSEIATEALFPSTNSQRPPAPCAVPAPDVWNTGQSYVTQLRTAELVGETFLLLASSLLF